jgi:hypothetical protein
MLLVAFIRSAPFCTELQQPCASVSTNRTSVVLETYSHKTVHFMYDHERLYVQRSLIVSTSVQRILASICNLMNSNVSIQSSCLHSVHFILYSTQLFWWPTWKIFYLILVLKSLLNRSHSFKVAGDVPSIYEISIKIIIIMILLLLLFI